MAIVNALLVRYARGFRRLSWAPSVAIHGRKEGFLSLGAIDSAAEVDRIASALFATMAFPVVTSTASLEPEGEADQPYTGFEVADRVTAPDEDGTPTSFRVRSLTVTEDNEGNPVFVPELRDVTLERDDAVQRWLKRMVNGTLGGRSDSASPVVERPGPLPPPTRELPPFSLPGLVAISESGRFYPPRPTRVVRVGAALQIAGSGSTTVQIRKNGVAAKTLTVPAGATRATDDSTFSLSTNDYLSVAVTAVGAGASDLVVTATGST